MLSQRDVENVFSRIDGAVEWEYWRDSGNLNCWFLAGGDWLLQVSHAENTIAINDQRDDDGYEMVSAGYNDERLGAAFVALAGTNPEAAFEHLCDQSASMVVDADISPGQH